MVSPVYDPRIFLFSAFSWNNRRDFPRPRRLGCDGFPPLLKPLKSASGTTDSFPLESLGLRQDLFFLLRTPEIFHKAAPIHSSLLHFPRCRFSERVPPFRSFPPNFLWRRIRHTPAFFVAMDRRAAPLLRQVTLEHAEKSGSQQDKNILHSFFTHGPEARCPQRPPPQ